MKWYYKEIDGEVKYSNGKLLVSEGVTIVNPSEEQMLAEGWQLYNAPEPSDSDKLAAAKEEKLIQINIYDASSEVEEFTINGSPMWLGHELRQQIRTSADAYEALGHETMTKVFNGVEFTFTIAVWRQMLNALEVYAAEALNTTERHKNAINNLTSVQDVIDYDYTVGYPNKLAFGETD